jgi:diamine N-acetyltransferase
MTEPTRESTVTLREVTKENAREIIKLQVSEAQNQFVAPNTISIAQAYFERDRAWFRAIYADDTPVGFLMLYDDPREPEYFLWRLMIDEKYQKLGFAYRAMQLLIEYVKTRPSATSLGVSYVPAEGSPAGFYQKVGFVETGEVHEGENVMRLALNYDEGETPAPPLGKPLTHVVLFKLKERTPENITQTAELLRSMSGNVPTLRGIEVGTNVVESARAYDIALITRFDDLAGMKAYQAHPFHQEILKHMHEAAEAAVAVDYES